MKYIIIILFIFSGFFYYYFLTQPVSQEFLVLRVIDGDTLELENQIKIRLLGINTPEKNQKYYDEAAQLLKKLAENKTIKIKWQDSDKYGRILAYAFLGKKLVNKEILEKGFANLYYYEKDNYYSNMKQAEEKARQEEAGIWKKSQNYGCLKLIELKYKEPEQLILKNSCQKIKITLKDDATHIYQEEIPSGIWIKNFSHIWNNDGDSLFVWDDSGLLVFYRY